MLQNKKEVIKHSAAIQIENSISLLERRIWNWLLANAYDELPTAETHSIAVADLMKGLGYTSRNLAHLKETLKALTGSVLEWNVIHKDKEVWGATTLLAEVEIEDGICTYAFGPMLRKRLYNPKDVRAHQPEPAKPVSEQTRSGPVRAVRRLPARGHPTTARRRSSPSRISAN